MSPCMGYERGTFSSWEDQTFYLHKRGGRGIPERTGVLMGSSDDGVHAATPTPHPQIVIPL